MMDLLHTMAAQGRILFSAHILEEVERPPGGCGDRLRAVGASGDFREIRRL